MPHRDQRVVRYRLPAGYRLESLPEDLAREAPFGQFAMTWRANGDEITVERSVTLSSPRIEVPDYPAFRDFAGELRAADARVLVVARQGRSR